MFTSPLEQFEIILLKPISLFNLVDISFTNATLFLILVILFWRITFYFSLKGSYFLPSFIQLILEALFSFVKSIVKQQSGIPGLRYLPIFFSIFLLVLGSNLIGLIPFAFTPTSHIALTFPIAVSCNLALIIIGLKENGFQFFQLFVPKGSPVWLLPLIVVIEVLSYLLRSLSLSIRLFANMMAGHTLIHILTSFAVSFLKASHVLIALFPILLVILVFVLELAIAFLQAYVFVILLCIYLNDSLHPVH